MINEKYILKKLIGEGRSKVFLCEDINFPGRNIAIKILPTGIDKNELANFRNEYFILKRLNHPNIIKASELGTVVTNSDGIYNILPGSEFITLEYVEAPELSNFEISTDEDLISVIRQLSSVLYYLHQSNFIYYDLKPENILVAGSQGKFTLKLVDLGLAEYIYCKEEIPARGTAEFIAPEILKKEDHDHRVDLYSFGILLYYLIYKKYPFDTTDQLEIYKAHLKGEFEFPETNFSSEIIKVVKKLVAKEKEERYYLALEVLYDLGLISNEIKNDLVPARTFANRKDVLSVVKYYINNDTGGEIITIRGTEGAGKTSLLEEIFAVNENAIYLRYRKISGSAFLKDLLRSIVFNSYVYAKVDNSILDEVLSYLKSNTADWETFRTILIRLISKIKFILLIDEFNRYDEFDIEILNDMMPILQVHQIKIILSEDSSYPYIAESLNNISRINLTPFTEAQIIEYLDRSFAVFFPTEEIKKLVMMYSDLLPGSVAAFFRDLISLNVLDFSTGFPQLIIQDERLSFLKGSQEGIYSTRLMQLSSAEMDAAKYLALFETNIDEKVLSLILGKDINETSEITTSLREKNILSSANLTTDLTFTSEGLKKYLASIILNKSEFHLRIAEIIEKHLPDYGVLNLAMHFKEAGLYYRSYELLKTELKVADKLSALQYKKKLLQDLCEYPLFERDLLEIKYELAITLFNLGDKLKCLALAEELLERNKQLNSNLELLSIKGNCLISIGSINEGVEVLKNLLPAFQNKKAQYRLLMDIATAEFDLNKYESVYEICNKIITSDAEPEIRGKSFNLLALAEIYDKSNLETAIENFHAALNIYQKENLVSKISGVEVNLGNIYNMQRKYEKAEEHWKIALRLNSSIGNLDQEAKLLQNYGIYFFGKNQFEKAIEQYKRAQTIFTSMGDKIGEGQVLMNLSEVFMVSCELQKGYESLKRARKIFREIQNAEEESEALFMIGKFYFMIGHTEMLSEIITDLESLININTLPEKAFTYLNLLKLLDKISMNVEIDTDSLKDLRDKFLILDEEIDAVFVTFVLVNYLLSIGEYIQAEHLLNEINLTGLCADKPLLMAQGFVYQGEIAAIKEATLIGTCINYYEKAYEILENEHVNEITWKTLLKLALTNNKRGNITKAVELASYAKAAIYFISDSIKDNELRQSYLLKKERTKALEILLQIEEKE